MRLRLVEVSRERIRTEIVEDTSFLSHYLQIEGTEVQFEDLGAARTRVSLIVRYRRLLDPASVSDRSSVSRPGRAPAT